MKKEQSWGKITMRTICVKAYRLFILSSGLLDTVGCAVRNQSRTHVVYTIITL